MIHHDDIVVAFVDTIGEVVGSSHALAGGFLFIFSLRICFPFLMASQA